MQYCKDCNTKMVGIMSFCKDKHEKFCRCPKCHAETKHHQINDKELNFGEASGKQIHRRK